MIKLILLTSLIALAQASVDCKHKNYGNDGTVCVCNAEHCDTVDPLEKLPSGQYVMYTSNLAGKRFFKEVADFASTSGAKKHAEIDHSEKFQTIHGFGGAFTDATGINANLLDATTRNHLMRSYFSKEGIEYSVGRVPIGGTDFSTRGYTYLDTPEPDMDLVNFALAEEDGLYKIPLIKEALELTENNLSLFASAWTAPKWMKSNGEYSGSGSLITKYYQTWVDYFIKFFDAYKEKGIEFWGLTTGNEPSLAFFTFTGINSIGWLPWTQNNWIKNNLGPTIRNHPSYKNLKLIAHDDQRILLPLLFTLFDDVEARSYMDGIGVHWYWDDFVPAQWLSQTHNRYPDKFIMGTEACKGDRPWDEAVLPGSWKRGQAYAVDIIEDLQHWSVGWVDWNMALNETGGPTYINNNVDAPIIVNTTTGEFFKQPSFYAMGHFSKFIPRGSIKIGAPEKFNGLHVVALDRPNDDGTTVVIINSEEKDVQVSLYDSNKGYITRDITAKSFNTIVYW
ncbi:lysosomal acid glucosylceramidase-like [Onthophagus taurus]|uniref:lysosomal acid glucosylceramidase-like n=1 Tax=Onthophagus taurus TaxID=166361 RepID=UPI0039BDABA7